jgi:hypothetical protein
VDVSVLVSVLNEEAHIRDAVAAMQAQRFDGTLGGVRGRHPLHRRLAAIDPGRARRVG